MNKNKSTNKIFYENINVAQEQFNKTNLRIQDVEKIIVEFPEPLKRDANICATLSTVNDNLTVDRGVSVKDRLVKSGSTNAELRIEISRPAEILDDEGKKLMRISKHKFYITVVIGDFHWITSTFSIKTNQSQAENRNLVQTKPRKSHSVSSQLTKKNQRTVQKRETQEDKEILENISKKVDEIHNILSEFCNKKMSETKKSKIEKIE